MRLEKFVRCLNCSYKVVESDDHDSIGCCTKCSMIQSISMCKHELSAKLMVKATNTSSYTTFQAYGKVILDIAQKSERDEVLMQDLLQARPFSLVHRNGFITSITRM